jgi:hypothetical protein
MTDQNTTTGATICLYNPIHTAYMGLFMPWSAALFTLFYARRLLGRKSSKV